MRTWNVAHGRTSPPTRRLCLERMVRLASTDAELVALQEVTPWAIGRLEAWSGMRAFAVVTKRGLLGPLARFFHELDPARVRSGLTGQANALLVHAGLEVERAPRSVLLNPGSPRERRVCQILRLHGDRGPIAVANLHATAHDAPAAREEVDRAGRLLTGEETAVLCGDFNVRRYSPPGFSAPIEGIDQIVVRGASFTRPPKRWPRERREIDGVLLSDHAPVEAVVA